MDEPDWRQRQEGTESAEYYTRLSTLSPTRDWGNGREWLPKLKKGKGQEQRGEPGGWGWGVGGMTRGVREDAPDTDADTGT